MREEEEWCLKGKERLIDGEKEGYRDREKKRNGV
jgi:hypothetical protein